VLRINSVLGCLGGVAVRRRTRDRKVTGSIPGRGAIKSTRSTQPSIPPGSVNRVPACMGGVRRGAFTFVGWQVTLCDPIWQVTSRSSEMGFPWRAISAFTFLPFTFTGTCTCTCMPSIGTCTGTWTTDTCLLSTWFKTAFGYSGWHLIRQSMEENIITRRNSSLDPVNEKHLCWHYCDNEREKTLLATSA